LEGYPPTPRGNSHEYQTKGLIEKGVCKLLKTKGDFAPNLRVAKQEWGPNASVVFARVRNLLISG
jgi:hypothetical protein